MSRFVDNLVEQAHVSPHGLTTGEPVSPVRRSWREVLRTAERYASRLRADGLQKGRVAILAGDLGQVVPGALAAWLCGASVTMLHEPTRRVDPVEWQDSTIHALRVIDVSTVLLGPPFEPFAAALAAAGIPATLLSELDGEPDLPFDRTAAAEDDLALLQLTSGSTAEPKAVRITHANLWSNLTDLIAAGDVRRDRDVTVSWVPLFHDMGMVGCLLVAMSAGTPMVSVTPADFLAHPGLWPDLLSRYGGSLTAAPNFAYALLARQLDRAPAGTYDLSRMRIAINGGEPIDPATMDAFTTAGARHGLPPECVNCSYGAAESVVVMTMSRPEDVMAVDVVDAVELEKNDRAVPVPEGPGVRRFPLLGYPLEHVELRVLAADGRVLGEREVGAIQVRGGPVTAGYLTADGPVDLPDADGWVDVGDLGYRVDGQYVVCGRTKDVIILAGRNIYPTDIERSASAVAGVRTGNAIAVRLTADGTAGTGVERESFAVLVESRGAGDPGHDAALALAVTERVAADIGARPARVLVLPPSTLPKTPAGKLRRSAARDLLRDTP